MATRISGLRHWRAAASAVALANHACPTRFFHCGWRSTRSAASASIPTPALTMKKRSSSPASTWPMVTGAACWPRARASTSRSIARRGCMGHPMVRANTFVLPVGMGASAAPVPTSAPAASAAVPSPPSVTTVSASCSCVASRARSAACPRSCVVSTARTPNGASCASAYSVSPGWAAVDRGLTRIAIGWSAAWRGSLMRPRPGPARGARGMPR